MDRQLRDFVLPYYQDFDGSTARFDEVERIAKIARTLYVPPAADARVFELMLLFHRLGNWLEKVGNMSRVMFAVPDLREEDMWAAAAFLRRLHAPVTNAERAIAAAILIDSAGVRGLMEAFGRARREGNSLMDMLRAALSDVNVPEWMDARAEAWLARRREARREVCRKILEELALDDLG